MRKKYDMEIGNMHEKDGQPISFNQHGDNNTQIGSVTNYNSNTNYIFTNGVNSTDLPDDLQVPFGSYKIPIKEKYLLEEFKKDYDSLIVECIKTDFTVPGIRLELGDEISILYHDKWDIKVLKIHTKVLRNLLLDALGALNALTEYLTPKYMRATPAGNCLIARNESIEEGNQLREVLRPETMRLRYKLRDLYRELHPEDFEGMPPYEDSYDTYISGLDGSAAQSESAEADPGRKTETGGITVVPDESFLRDLFRQLY